MRQKPKTRKTSNPTPTLPHEPKKICLLLVKAILLSIWVGLVVVASQYIVGYIMLWILGRDTLSDTLPTAIYSALTYILAFVVILLVTPHLITFARSLIHKKSQQSEAEHSSDKALKVKLENKKVGKKSNLRLELGLRGLPTWTDIGLAPVGLIISTLIATGCTWLMSYLPWFNAEEAQRLNFGVFLFGSDRIIAFIILVFVAPIAEELIFRGWLYGKLRTLFHNKISETWGIIVSIFLVSLVFAAMHGQWNVGVTVFVMSIVMCLMREITGTIYAGMLMHILKNGIAFFLIYVLSLGLGML